jgi:DNA-directed RNA polymerase specialized sigma24 family protein
LSHSQKEKNEVSDTLITEAHKTYAKKMGSYTFFKVRNRFTSDDIVQDTFIKTWEYLLKGG